VANGRNQRGSVDHAVELARLAQVPRRSVQWGPRFTEEAGVGALKQAEAGVPIKDLWCKYGVTAGPTRNSDGERSNQDDRGAGERVGMPC
jgi:hypothetical protein